MSSESVGVYQAKTHLTQLLDQVAQGKSFTITRHGKPVAMLAALPAERPPDLDRIVDRWRRYRAQHMDGGRDLDVRRAIDEGRV